MKRRHAASSSDQKGRGKEGPGWEFSKSTVAAEIKSQGGELEKSSPKDRGSGGTQGFFEGGGRDEVPLLETLRMRRRIAQADNVRNDKGGFEEPHMQKEL